MNKNIIDKIDRIFFIIVCGIALWSFFTYRIAEWQMRLSYKEAIDKATLSKLKSDYELGKIIKMMMGTNVKIELHLGSDEGPEVIIPRRKLPHSL